jgi:hypothetical protein
MRMLAVAKCRLMAILRSEFQPRLSAPVGLFFNCSLPPPALGERGHSRLARLGIAVRWASILMVPEGQRLHPRYPYGRGIGLEDAAKNLLANLMPAIGFQ